ncbi:hypothetical protein X777_08879 [Ooceraea biroi]|uniref:Uncharacterized protein n=1 Tax=Ooceraea biroi TaxID=2015173 RepID=A0A026W8F6_OOCBI|nr:hypothetical protein X777_08879 [Ooceraea biroi]
MAGVWPFGADGGLGGGLSVAGRDRWLEVAVTLEIADALADVFDVRRVDGEHGATAEHPVAPQNLADLGPTRSTAARNQRCLSDHSWQRR